MGRPNFKSFPPQNAISREDGGGGNRTHEPFPTDRVKLETIKGALERGNYRQARIWAGLSPEPEPFPTEFEDRIEAAIERFDIPRGMTIDLAGLKLEVKREGKFLNLHCYVIEGEGTLVSLWNFEPLDQAIPKLEALLAAAKLAAAE